MTDENGSKDIKIKELQKTITSLTKTIFFVVALGIVLTMIAMSIGINNVKDTKQEYSIESKILLNQMEEQNKIKANPDMNMEQYLEIRNKYLEKHFNILLEYKNPELSAYILGIEQCLEKYYTKTETENTSETELNQIAEECNQIGENIEKTQYKLMTEKIR